MTYVTLFQIINNKLKGENAITSNQPEELIDLCINTEFIDS